MYCQQAPSSSLLKDSYVSAGTCLTGMECKLVSLLIQASCPRHNISVLGPGICPSPPYTVVSDIAGKNGLQP